MAAGLGACLPQGADRCSSEGGPVAPTSRIGRLSYMDFQPKIMHPARHNKTVADMNPGRGGIGRSFLRPAGKSRRFLRTLRYAFLARDPGFSLRFTQGYYPAPPGRGLTPARAGVGESGR